MEKIINITGMGCEGCAAKVKKALEALPGVDRCEVELAAKRAVVTLHDTVSDQSLLDAVNAIGKYKATGVE